MRFLRWSDILNSAKINTDDCEEVMSKEEKTKTKRETEVRFSGDVQEIRITGTPIEPETPKPKPKPKHEKDE